MKKEEMQNLVDKIAEERKIHLDTIENLTLKQIKQIVSINHYFQRFLESKILYSDEEDAGRTHNRSKKSS